MPDKNPTQPRSLLFVCTKNACRSPMAEGLAKKYFKGDLLIQSVGLQPGLLDGFAISIMAEHGIDISNHTPKPIDDIPLENFDLLITLSPESHAAIMAWIGDKKIPVEHWPISDPSTATGNRDQILQSYRNIREEILRQLTTRFPQDEA